MSRTLFTTLCLATLVACGGDTTGTDGGGMVQVDPPAMVLGTGTTDTGWGACGPTELCTRSIDDCDVEMDLATCEDWYAVGDCRDMDAYIACNCDCNEQAECDGYFACGELCFEDHCL